MAKIATITLEYSNLGFEGKPYRVMKLTDSVEFNPGDLLTKKAVEELCSSKNWKVTIRHQQI